MINSNDCVKKINCLLLETHANYYFLFKINTFSRHTSYIDFQQWINFLVHSNLNQKTESNLNFYEICSM